MDQLRGLPGAKDAEAAWAGAAAGPGYDCDATIVPIVTGHIDPAVLDRLAAALLRGRAAKTGQDSQNGPDSEADAARRRLAERAARQIVIAHAADLMSGPAGLAAYLRTGLLHSPAASVSLPLDAGAATETIPRAPNGPPGHRPGPPLPLPRLHSAPGSVPVAPHPAAVQGWPDVPDQELPCNWRTGQHGYSRLRASGDRCLANVPQPRTDSTSPGRPASPGLVMDPPAAACQIG